MGLVRQAKKLTPDLQQEFLNIRTAVPSTKLALDKFHAQHPELKDKFGVKDAQNCYYRHRLRTQQAKVKTSIEPAPEPPQEDLPAEAAPKREQLMLVIDEPVPKEPKSRRPKDMPKKSEGMRWTKEQKEKITQRTIELRKLSLRWTVISEKIKQEFDLEYAPSIAYLRILYKTYMGDAKNSKKNCTIVITSSNLDLTAHVTTDRLSSVLLTLVQKEE